MNQYYIIAKIDGVTSFYHSDKAFYSTFIFVGGCQFKTWKRLSYARQMFNRIRVGGRIDSVSLMSVGVGGSYREDGVIIASK